MLLIGLSNLKKKKTSNCSDSNFLNVNVFCFVFCFNSSVTVNWIYLGYGQKQTFEDIILGFGKSWLMFFTIFLTFDRPNK